MGDNTLLSRLFHTLLSYTITSRGEMRPACYVAADLKILTDT